MAVSAARPDALPAMSASVPALALIDSRRLFSDSADIGTWNLGLLWMLELGIWNLSEPRLPRHSDLHDRRGCLPRKIFRHECFLRIHGCVPSDLLASIGCHATH